MTIYHERTVRSLVWPDAEKVGKPQGIDEGEIGDTGAAEAWIQAPRSIANGVSDLRLDAYYSTDPHITTVYHYDIVSDKAITVKIGTTSAEAQTMRPGSDGKAHLSGDISLTRSATVGFWVANATGAAATVQCTLVGV